MKKILLVILLIFMPISVMAKEKIDVKFASCVDGDTANLIIDGEIVKVRFLAVDTPETKHPKKGEEPFGKEASDYTCNTLKNASSIQIEYDNNADKKDKYDRDLVWIFTDNELLQEKLVRGGYAKVAYLYGDYKYTNILKKQEKIAKEEHLRIWSEEKEDNLNIYIVVGIIIIFIIILILFPKYRKKVLKKTKSNIKRKAKKEIKKLLE